MPDKKIVRYEDFGAKGDGKTCDFAAMKAAHSYANENGLTVVAEPGKSYYVSANVGADAIRIKTDTVWNGATIVIDDREVLPDAPERSTSVFSVDSDYSFEKYETDSELVQAINAAGGIKTTTKKLPFGFGYKAMVIPYNTEHKIYIRYGPNHNSGSDQHELLLIDEEGNIDVDTPALLDYDNISYVQVLRVDDKPITISGGTLITVANKAPCAYTYYSRNISIKRSNTTVRGLTHKIAEEGDTGAPYTSFVGATNMNNLLVEDCTFQAHRCYMDEFSYKTPMGTYEIGGFNSNKMYYKRCKQSNFYDKDGKATMVWYDENGNMGIRNDNPEANSRVWGLMGSNYCKNITYDECTLNRLDAHAGVYNCSIINNSNVIHVALTGGGVALIENSTIHNWFLCNLRDDYGSTWKGEVIVRNVTQVTDFEEARIFHGFWFHHYFGYKCHLPSITLDNFKVSSGIPIYLFNALTERHSTIYQLAAEDSTKYPIDGVDISADKVMINGKYWDNVNKTSLPEFIKVMNCEGLVLKGSPDATMNKQIEKIIERI